VSASYRPTNPSPFGPDRYTGGRDTVLFLLSVAIATTFLLGPSRWGEATASAVRSTVLVPFLWLQAQAEDGRDLRARFVAVEAQRDSVAWDAQALPILRAENERLRSLLRMTERIGVPYRPAEVMRQTQITDGRTLVVNAGSRAGVRPFDPVVSPEGLVGAVLTVDRATSVVMTWANPEFRVSAATEDGSVLGLVAAAQTESNNEPLLELRGVPYRDTVPAGTLVVTTGLGGIYPQGVMIGRVVGVAREQEGWERIYMVRPAVNLGTLGHVLLLGREAVGMAAMAAAEQAAARPAVRPPAAPVAPADSTPPPRRRRPRPAADTTAPRPADSAPATTPATTPAVTP
jgi:rod shape-determining protein MreC